MLDPTEARQIAIGGPYRGVGMWLLAFERAGRLLGEWNTRLPVEFGDKRCAISEAMTGGNGAVSDYRVVAGREKQKRMC